MTIESLIQELDAVILTTDIDYFKNPMYYDRLIDTFYITGLYRTFYHFEIRDSLEHIDWSKFHTHMIIKEQQQTNASIGNTLDNTTYCKDSYYDIAYIFYKYRDVVDIKNDTIRQWLINNEKSQQKPFVLMHLVGMLTEHKNDNKIAFMETYNNFKNINWNQFDPKAPSR